jgi:hypothetical protein
MPEVKVVAWWWHGVKRKEGKLGRFKVYLLPGYAVILNKN